MDKAKITHVAIMQGDKVWSLPSPNRHHNVIRLIHDTTGAFDQDGTQGFLDSDGVFLERVPALQRAKEVGQLRTDRPVMLQLYSENLW